MTSTLMNINKDAMADAKKNSKFRQASKDAMPRVRLAVEVYGARNTRGLSQQSLAKEINSTQKIISRVENGDMDLGIGLLGRFVEKLSFNSDTLARIFHCGQAVVFITAETKKIETQNNLITIAGSENLKPTIMTNISSTFAVSSPSQTVGAIISGNSNYLIK